MGSINNDILSVENMQISSGCSPDIEKAYIVLSAINKLNLTVKEAEEVLYSLYHRVLPVEKNRHIRENKNIFKIEKEWLNP